MADRAGRAAGLGFRFVFVYFLLFIPTVPLNQLPIVGRVVGVWDGLWLQVVPWVGRAFLGLGQVVPVGGDTPYHYVKMLCQIVLAVVAALAWSAVPSRSSHDATLHDWLRVAVRYFLAAAMFNYGVVKLFNTQFLPLEPDRLILRYGDSSPAALLWAFMGYSNAYTTFAGAGEVVGALLLFFRRTTTLGALLLSAQLVNIVMMNFCYDVGAKLFSMHLLLMALFLLAPELPRLANVLVLNRPTVPVVLRRPPPARWMVLARLVAKTAFVGMVVVFMTGGALSLLMKKWMANPPLYGLYEVETFTLGDKTLPPLVTDASRWRWFIVGRYNQLTVEAMNGQRQVFFVRHDPQTRTLNVFDPRDSTPIGLLSYVQNKSDHLSMSGFIGSDPLAMQLRRVDESTFLLVNRGFKWSRESYD
ncbi:MAG: hypothetical protein ACHQKZ_03680 [Solirubrobacterales bacterium]|jgi:hypothetical protein